MNRLSRLTARADAALGLLAESFAFGIVAQDGQQYSAAATVWTGARGSGRAIQSAHRSALAAEAALLSLAQRCKAGPEVVILIDDIPEGVTEWQDEP